MATAAVPSPEALFEDLRKFIRVGARPASLPDIPNLLGLSVVGVAAFGNSSVDRALALMEVLRDAITGLGEGPAAQSLELLLGVTPRSKGLLLKDRRDLAAEALGVDVETWRRHWEKPLLLELATEIYRMENEQRVVVRVSSTRHRGTTVEDFRYGRGGKSLDRREAEARIFSVMYALRADLLAVARLKDETARAKFVESSLWRFAVFVEAMSRFADEYGSAIVMAGSEVSVREAASLLGWRPPLTDEETGELRVLLGGSDTSGRDAFLARLGCDARGQKLLAVWRAWLDADRSRQDA